MKLFRRKLTPEYIRKHYTRRTDLGPFEIYEIGQIDSKYENNNVFIEIGSKEIYVAIGNKCPVYWLCPIEYIYQLKQILKIYKIIE